VEGVADCGGTGTNLGAGFSDDTPRQATRVALIPDVQSIVLGASTGYAIHGGGQLVGWGSSYNCQLLGNAITSTPSLLLPDVEWVVAGGTATSACARTSDGGTLCWGDNGNHELPLAPDDAGLCKAPRVVSSPKPLDLGAPIVALSLSVTQGCAALEGGAVTCFGDYVDIGSGAPVAPGPIVVPNISDAVGVAVGVDYFACARTQGGAAVCWGGSGNGTTGRGTNARELPPDKVVDSNFVPLAGVVEIAAGDSFACARLADGGVSCWGTNVLGQLGDGTNAPHNVAQPVVLPP
jgi:alpha-tubulin suppressor-like RCC1 family protein